MEKPDRHKIPEARDFTGLSLPDCRQLTASNGLSLFTLHASDTSAVRLVVSYPVGTYYTSSPEAMLMLGRMFEEGAGKLSGSEITEEIDFNGSALSTAVGANSLQIILTSVRSRILNLLPLLRTILLEPVFPQEILTRKAVSFAETISVNRLKVQNMALRRLLPLLFGESHPGSHITDLEKLRNVTTSELLHIHREEVLACRPDFWLAGNVEGEIIEATLRMIGSLPVAQNPLSPKLRPMNPVATPCIVEEMAENQAQSYIKAVIPLVPDSAVDLARLNIVNTLLGGYFGSRLMQNLRETRGLTYGVHSNLAERPEGCYLSIDCQLAAGKEDEALREIENELRRLVSDPPRGEELRQLRSTILGTSALMLDTVFTVVARRIAEKESGMSSDAFSHLVSAVESVTPEEISNTASRYLSPDKIIAVVVKGGA